MSATTVCYHRNVSLEAVADAFDDSNVRLLRLRLRCIGCGHPMKFVGVREGMSIDAPATLQQGVAVTMPFVVADEEPDSVTIDLV